jgi:hypothetical protein
VILQGESEGIVRREAAALLKEIYEHHKFLWVDVHLYLTHVTKPQDSRNLTLRCLTSMKLILGSFILCDI